MRKRRLEIAALVALLIVAGIERPSIGTPEVAFAIDAPTIDVNAVDSVADLGRAGVLYVTRWVVAQIDL